MTRPIPLPRFLVVRFAVLACASGAAGSLVWSQPTENSPATLEKELAQRSQLVLLGTGTPNAHPHRSGPAVAVIVDGRPYIVDAGPGVVRRATLGFSQGITGLQIQRLDTVFITHLHSDHTLGLPDLIFTPWVVGREEPLKVFGPPGVKSMTDHLLQAYSADIKIRTEGLEQGDATGYKVEATEIEPGVVFSNDSVTVKAFRVDHGSIHDAFGYRFETPERVIVISGDTSYSENLIENARGCDILVHEVYAMAGFVRRYPSAQRYHASFHTSTEQLARVANEVRPGLLVLYHQLSWGATREDFLSEISKLYDGPVVYGDDLDVF